MPASPTSSGRAPAVVTTVASPRAMASSNTGEERSTQLGVSRDGTTRQSSSPQSPLSAMASSNTGEERSTQLGVSRDGTTRQSSSPQSPLSAMASSNTGEERSTQL